MPARIFVLFALFIACLTDLIAVPLSEALNDIPTATTLTGSDSFIIVQTGIGKKASNALVTGILQPFDDDLTSLAGASGTNAIYYRSAAGTWAPVTVGTGLSFTGGTLTAPDTGGGTWGSITGTLSNQTDLQTALNAKQPLDADLTAIAATAAIGSWYYRSAADTWTAVVVGSGLSFSSGTLSATGGASVWGAITGTLSNQTDLQSALDGKQALDGDLTALAAISATGSFYYRSATNAWSPVTVGSGLSFTGGNLTASATAPAWGSITGTLSNQTDLQSALDGKQGLDADLTALAALSTTGNFFYRSASNTWTPVVVGSGLSFAGGTLSAADSGAAIWGAITGTLSTQTDLQSALNGKQTADGDLSSLSAASSTNSIYYRSATDTWNPVSIGTTLAFSAGTLNVATVPGTSVSFSDSGNRWTATNVDAALTELSDVNILGPNQSNSKVDWSQIKNMPSGFADGVDDTSGGGGGGTLSVVKENGTTVGTTMTTLDFLGADFDITESPSSEANISIANDAITFAKMQNIATGVLLGRSTASTGDIETIAVGAGLLLSGGTLSATGSGSSVAWGSITGTLSSQTDLQTALDAKQPLDGDLTAIAAISATGSIYYRSAANTWTAVTVGSGLTFTGGTLNVGDLSGTYQPLDADLISLAGTSGTNTIYYRSATNTWSAVTIGSNLTFAGGTLSAAASPATWGSITGTLASQTDLQSALDGKQALDADLTALAGISATGSFYYRSASNTWTAVAIGSGLTFTSGTLASTAITPAWGSITGTLSSQTDLQTALDGKQPLDSDLTALAGISATGSFYYRSAANTWTPVVIGSGLTFSGGTLASSAVSVAWGSITGTLSSQADLNTALNARQPLDADLTSLAAISATGSFYYHSAANTWSPVTVGSGLTFSAGTIATNGGANWGSITGTLSSQTDLQTSLDAKQALDADLTALAGISTTGSFYYRSAANTWTPVTIGTGLTFTSGTLASSSSTTTWGSITGTLSSQTDLNTALNARQPLDADLTSLAGASTTGNIYYRSASNTWSPVTIGFGLSFLSGTISTNGIATWGSIGGTLSAQTDLQTALDAKQPLDGDLTSLAAAVGTNTIYYRSAANTFSPVTIGAGLTFTGGTLTAPALADLDVLPVTTSGALDADDVFVVSVDGTESKISTTEVEAWIESLSLNFATISATQFNAAALEFEGATADANETTLNVVDPTADRTVLLPNADTTLMGKDTVDSMTNKTLDVDASGNLLKFHSLPQFTSPGRVDGTGCTIGTTATSVGYGLPIFSGSADEAANYAEYRFIVPADWNVSVDPKVILIDKLNGADTNTRQYSFQVAYATSSQSALTAPGTKIDVNMAADASGASDDIEVSPTTTLTGWSALLTPGKMMTMRVARDGDEATTDASSVASTLIAVELQYAAIQPLGSIPPTPTVSDPTILWWKMLDGSGSTITAAVGPNGSFNGSWSDGGIQFNGTSQYAASSTAVAYGGTQVVTLSMWVQATSWDTGGTVQTIFNSAFGGANGTFWVFEQSGTLFAQLLESGGARDEYFTVSGLTTGAWYHLAIVYDNSTTTGDIKIYLNGALQTTTVSDGKGGAGIISNQTVFAGAANATPTHPFSGKIDDVRIYDLELNSTEIADIYAAGRF